MHRSRGFTLLELMIVVAIISILAALAIPSLLNARKSANETSAIAFLKMAVGINIQYRTRFGSFPSVPVDLFNSGFVDQGQDPTGYVLNMVSTSATWSLTADPEVPGDSGDRYFYADQSGVIRFEMSTTATTTSPPLGESSGG